MRPYRTPSAARLAPASLADALVQLAALEEPPARFAAGADTVATF